MARVLSGRRFITTDENEINGGNILRILNDVESTHLFNSADVKYLWEYYKGKQPILGRKKTDRKSVV